MFGLFGGKKKLLVYTDSRGDNIPGHLDYEHYSVLLEKKYNVEKYLCPEKWTTTLDFLKLMKHKSYRDYDHIILHTGIVEQSPRHQKVAIENLYADKKGIFDEVFGEAKMKDHLQHDFGVEYEGDKTVNMYSLKMAEKDLLPILRRIPNLIWVSGNRIVPGWNGNYWKERPKNISLIEDYFSLFLENLPNTVNLMKWTNDEIIKYTFDNMHPNKEGSDYIYNSLIRHLN